MSKIPNLWNSFRFVNLRYCKFFHPCNEVIFYGINLYPFLNELPPRTFYPLMFITQHNHPIILLDKSAWCKMNDLGECKDFRKEGAGTLLSFVNGFRNH